MATYVLLSSLTSEGGQTLHAHPDRLSEVNNEIDGFGCHVISQYALLGPYDFLTIVEAPDNETVAHLSVDLASRGTVQHHDAPCDPDRLPCPEAGRFAATGARLIELRSDRSAVESQVDRTLLRYGSRRRRENRDVALENRVGRRGDLNAHALAGTSPSRFSDPYIG